ncbi:hypothetical protein EK21DRAFT_84479 [Setomelanomma holmii]|uniref:Uncharacterized protein n=1 Tax=Setomelanomma holmii TaxID=210430 RepID=A0A9P4HIX7_9PLEO|nr:hypothetical protein EK21DRAFT_84479 [Setomelanomma holmii]
MKQYNLFLFLSIALSWVAGAVPTAELLGAEAFEHAALDARQVSTTDCRRGLSCSYDYIEMQPMDWRLGYLKTIQSGYLPTYNSGTQCKAVEGQITFNQEAQLGSPKTWKSCVNAGLIEAIQLAVGNLVGLYSRDGGNPGVKYWLAFFRKQRAGWYTTDRNQHDSDWSVCEEVSSEYGRQRVGQKGYKPTQRETTSYQSNQAYRYVMRNNGSASVAFRGGLSNVGLLNGLLGSVLSLVTGLIAWVTDVTNPRACYSFYNACYTYINASASMNLSITAILQGMAPSLLSLYRS